MKKSLALLWILALVSSLLLGAAAAETGMSISDATGQPGDTVYLAVKVNTPVAGNSIGISYAYDGAVLEAVPEACSWSIKGVLQDFDKNDQGVWATEKATELSGTVCVLAFRIREGIRFTETTVSCTLSIQNSGKEVAGYTAETTVSYACSHEFGDWTDSGSIGHSRECALCQRTQTQSHVWDNGTIKENPDSLQTDWKVFACTVCGGTKYIEIPKSSEELPETTEQPQPSETMPPLHTAPSDPEPETETRPQYTRPTTPGWTEDPSQDPDDGTSDAEDPTGSSNSFRDYNDIPYATDEHGHVVGNTGDLGNTPQEQEQGTLPLSVPSNEETGHEDHDHSHESTVTTVSRKQQNQNLLLILVTVAALVAAGAWFLKKKK